MRKNAGGFLELNLLLVVLASAALVAAVMYFIHLGVDKERARSAAALVEAQATRTKIISGLATDLAAEREKTADARRVAETQRKELTDDYEKRLHQYVPAGTACLRAGFVRYTDAAAAGVRLPAGPELGLAEAPAGVGDDVEAGIIVRNYARYHACEARVADILTEFDGIRAKYNAVASQINHVPQPP